MESIGSIDSEFDTTEVPGKRRYARDPSIKRCDEITKKGNCRGIAGPTGKCVFHNGNFSDEEKRAWRVRGGKRTKPLPDEMPVNLNSEQDIKLFLEWVATKLRRQEISARDATAFVACARECRAMIEDSVDKRVKALEKRLKESK